MQYTRAFIFSKRTNLMPYFLANFGDISKERYDSLKKHYAAERDVQLILLARYDGGKMICRIKCPINPMPVRGEFTASSVYDVFAFLEKQGWAHQQTINLTLFK